jgi:hypothetical protein
MVMAGGKAWINVIDDVKTVREDTRESANETWRFDVTWTASRLQYEGDHVRE